MRPGACTFTFTEAEPPLDPRQFEENDRTGAMKMLSATSATPDSLEVGGTRFAGTHVKGRPPTTGVMGVLATLADEASVETYGGAIGSTERPTTRRPSPPGVAPSRAR